MSASQSQPDAFGRYRLLRLLGRGGATAVYLAGDPASDREVALKILISGDGELRERFLVEARFASCLRHPGIVEVFEVGHVGARPFVSMEYVPGETWASMLARRAPLSTLERLEVATELAQALGYAHQMGVPHGDLRPTNVLIDEAGAVRLLDFGIGRVANSAGLTNAHIPIGPFNYLSPEQLTGEPLTARSDIFSFGVLVYEWLSHQQAFPGIRNTKLIQRILAGEHEPLGSVRPDLPAEVVEIVERLLEPHAPHRVQNFEIVVADLSDVCEWLERRAESVASLAATEFPPNVEAMTAADVGAPTSDAALPVAVDVDLEPHTSHEPEGESVADFGALLEAAAEPVPSTAPEALDVEVWEVGPAFGADLAIVEEPVIEPPIERRMSDVWPASVHQRTPAASTMNIVPLESSIPPAHGATVVPFDDGSASGAVGPSAVPIAAGVAPEASPSPRTFDAAEAILRRIDEIDLKSSDLSDLLMEFDRVESVSRSRANSPAQGDSSADDAEAVRPTARHATR